MAIIKNHPDLKNLRRHLRKNLTKPEQLLWAVLRGGQLNGYKFRRQYGVGRFVLDFYCVQKKLGIEIDGDTHFTLAEELYDQKRSDFLKLFGINIIRFTNLDVRDNIEGVVAVILDNLSHPLHLPLKPGGG